MNCVTEQMFFLLFCNSSPTCRGRRILAIYYVKTFRIYLIYHTFFPPFFLHVINHLLFIILLTKPANYSADFIYYLTAPATTPFMIHFWQKGLPLLLYSTIDLGNVTSNPSVLFPFGDYIINPASQ